MVTFPRASTRSKRTLLVACAVLLAASGGTALLFISHALNPSGHTRQSRKAAPQPPTRLAPASVTLRLADLPRGFAIDHANTGPVSWHDLANLATTRRLALLHRNGLLAEYDASFYRTSTWLGQLVDFLGIRTVATTFKTTGGARHAFDDPHNPVLSLTRWMTPVPTTTHEADDWQEAAHTDHTGHTTILVRWRAGRITGGLVLFGPSSRATTTYASTLALISLRRAVQDTRSSTPGARAQQRS